MLERAYPSPRAAWDLFHFVDGSDQDHARIVAYGVDPWWTHPEFRLSLLRPLPSLLRALDHSTFRDEPVPQHVHSFLWWGLMLVATGALLFEVLPPLAAACALALFSVDESQTVPVLWLSNRSALVATAFALASLWCHLRFRRGAPGPFRVASVAFFIVALTGGEYALASCGYVVCMELASRHPGMSRARALMPTLALGVAFIAVSTALGYGSAHSALYTSPFSAPLDYATKIVTGLPVLIGELTLGIPADWWSFGSPWPAALRDLLGTSSATWDHLPSWHAWQVSFGLAGGLLTLGLYVWLRPRLSAAHAHALRWLIGGAVLGLLPVLGSFVTTRLAMPSSVGFAALFGSAVAEGLKTVARAPALTGFRTNSNEPQAQWSQRATAPVLLIAALVLWVHGYRALAESRRSTDMFSVVARSRTAWPLTPALDDRVAGSQDLVMFAAADANDAAHMPFVRFGNGHPLLRSFRLLSGSPTAHEVTRVDANTLELRVLDDWGLQGSVVGSLTRADGDELPVGTRVAVPGMNVEVLETRAGQPVRMRYRFDVPLEHPSLVFVKSTTRGLQTLAPPRIGTRLKLEKPTMPDIERLERTTAERR